MNLRDLAKRDSAVIVEGEQAGNTLLTLSDPLGNTWSVVALLSDIGYEVDTDGNKVAGRTCWATYKAERVKDAGERVLTPRRGWKVKWTDLEGREQKMFVSFSEPDLTLGLNRIFMTANLAVENGGND